MKNKKRKEREDCIDKIALEELRFSNMRREHYETLLYEVKSLLDWGVAPKVISSVIDNWLERWLLDITVHYQLINK